MPSKNRPTLLFPEGIGLVSRLSRASKPFVRLKNGSLRDGDLLLQLTLKELGTIKKMSKETHSLHPELYEDIKSQYYDLLDVLSRLENASQSAGLFNILKRLEIRRDTHALVDAGYDLYITTKSTSDKMQRALLSQNSTVEEVEGQDILQNEEIKGISFDMDEEETASILTTDPFADPIAPDHVGNQIPSQNFYNVYIGCVNADNSDAHTITMNNGGSENPTPGPSRS